VCELLLVYGHTVTSIDNLNNVYDVHIKDWHLKQLHTQPGFHLHLLDISKQPGLGRAALFEGLFEPVISLAVSHVYPGLHFHHIQ
jgi:hypothetical protein